MNDFQKFIHQRTYARYLPEDNRRETWIETCNRYANYILNRGPRDLPKEDHEELVNALVSIKKMQVMPSMRLMHSAGHAMDLENMCGYNCGYLPIDSIRAFSELLYVLMCGTGCGFSVERHYINGLPETVPIDYSKVATQVQVEDSREGWALSLWKALSLLWDGTNVSLDVSKVRPKNSPLKTFGGRASGPEPLIELVDFCKGILSKASERPTRLITTVEAYDMACKIAQCVISGGVRRSATICLFSDDDEGMLYSKTIENMQKFPWRCYSNNSVVVGNPKVSLVTKVMSLAKITGEPGIFNRGAALVKAQAQGRDGDFFGCNPCGEIILKPRQLCNLTEVVLRPNDSVEDMMNKVEWATILGTIQSSFTKFNHRILRTDWRTNSETERLLGVSLTGICDALHDVYNANHLLDMLREHARLTNVKWANLLGIQRSKAITCVKPSGTVSQLVDSSSGCHPRYSQYYNRYVQVSAGDPLAKLMKDQGVPLIYDGFSGDPVFVFPMASPVGALTIKDLGVDRAFNLNRSLMENWCDHNVSQTITLEDHEWELALGKLMMNFENIIGITMFPKTPTEGRQWVPYSEITKEQYEEAIGKFPKLDFSLLPKYELVDSSESSHEYACTGGSCSL